MPAYWAGSEEFKVLRRIYQTVIAPVLEKSEEAFKDATHISTWNEYTLRPLLRRVGYWDAERMTPDQLRNEIVARLRSHGVMNEAEFVRIVQKSIECDITDVAIQINTHHNIGVTLRAQAADLDYTAYKKAGHPLFAYDILVMNLGYAFPAGVRLILDAILRGNLHNIYAGSIATANILLTSTATYPEGPDTNGYVYDATTDTLIPVTYDDEAETVIGE